jgi:hypothetical protein
VRVVVRVYYTSVLVASAHADNATLAASPVHPPSPSPLPLPPPPSSLVGAQ